MNGNKLKCSDTPNIVDLSKSEPIFKLFPIIYSNDIYELFPYLKNVFLLPYFKTLLSVNRTSITVVYGTNQTRHQSVMK